MFNKFVPYLFLVVSLFTSTCFAQEREIAITIDDLPFVGTTSNKPSNLKRENDRFLQIMQTLIDYHVPATGFVIAGTIEHDQWQLLEQFKQAGFVLGNHTYSHNNLNQTNGQKYMDDIAHADKILTPLFSGTKYFRYPYLAEGRGETKQQVHDFLTANQYTVAPVTIDSKDFQFNEELFRIPYRSRPQNLERMKKRYLSYIWNQTLRAERQGVDKPQILLIHANLLNSHFLGDILKMYKDNGYQFVSLDQAMAARAPLPSSIPPIYPLANQTAVISNSH